MPGSESAQVSQQTDTVNQAVLSICRDLLLRDDVTLDDNFFSLGGDSMGALSLLWHLNERFAKEAPLIAVLSAPTLAAIGLLFVEADEQGEPLCSAAGA